MTIAMEYKKLCRMNRTGKDIARYVVVFIATSPRNQSTLRRKTKIHVASERQIEFDTLQEEAR
jgi:hypothetical protein